MLTVLIALRAEPHGAWDAWAMWNLRARILFRGAPNWADVFHPEISHSEYPVLLPLLNARIWTLTGRDTTVGPRALAFAFTVLTGGLLFTTVNLLRGRIQACLALLAALASPLLLRYGPLQLADVPLAFFMLASLCCVALACSGTDERDGALVLAGAFAGFAAWTKNEGQLFAAVLPAAVGTMTWLQAGMLRTGARLKWLLTGLAPILVSLWIVNTGFVAGRTDFFAQPLGIILAKVSDFARHKMILLEAYNLFSLRATLCAVGILVFFLAAAGLRRRGPGRDVAATVLATLILLTCGFYIIYLISPFDLRWHVAGSAERLFVQLWPMSVLMVFLATRTPEEATLDFHRGVVEDSLPGQR